MTPERDSATEITLSVASAPAVLAATTAGPLVDCMGFRSATVLINIGVGGITFTGTNRVDFELQAGDASDGSDLADVTDADLIKDAFCPATVAGGIVRSLTSAHAAADVQKVGYIGGKRYLKLIPTFGGTHGTGTPIAASIVLENAAVEGAA